MTQIAADPITLTLADFRDARARIAEHIKHTPLLTSRQLSEATGYDVRLKAEMFQRGGCFSGNPGKPANSAGQRNRA